MAHLLTGICLLTNDVQRLRDFYCAVLEHNPVEDSEGYVSFSVGNQVLLSIYSLKEMAVWAPKFGVENLAGRCSLEFEIADADIEYQRLVGLGVSIVRPPTTYPWGLRAVWFSDPDRNLITFHARVNS